MLCIQVLRVLLTCAAVADCGHADAACVFKVTFAVVVAPAFTAFRA